MNIGKNVVESSSTKSAKLVSRICQTQQLNLRNSWVKCTNLASKIGKTRQQNLRNLLTKFAELFGRICQTRRRNLPKSSMEFAELVSRICKVLTWFTLMQIPIGWKSKCTHSATIDSFLLPARRETPIVQLMFKGLKRWCGKPLLVKEAADSSSTVTVKGNVSLPEKVSLLSKKI